MKAIELTVTRVGNSRAVRLPAEVLRRYRVGEKLIMEQRPDEIVLRPKRTRQQKLNWVETYQQMAQSEEDWSEWESLPWVDWILPACRPVRESGVNGN